MAEHDDGRLGPHPAADGRVSTTTYDGTSAGGDPPPAEHTTRTEYDAATGRVVGRGRSAPPPPADPDRPTVVGG